MESLRAAWHARNTRDRIVLKAGACAVALLLFYAFVWEPARTEQERLRQSLPRLREQAAQFAADAAEAKRLRSLGLAKAGGSGTPATVEAAAERTGLRASIKSITEAPGGRLRIALDPVPYGAWVRWIGELSGSAGFTVESVQLRAGAAPGTVIVEKLEVIGAGPS